MSQKLRFFLFFFSFSQLQETVDLLPTLGTRGVKVAHGDLFTQLSFSFPSFRSKTHSFILMETLMVYLIPQRALNGQLTMLSQFLLKKSFTSLEYHEKNITFKRKKLKKKKSIKMSVCHETRIRIKMNQKARSPRRTYQVAQCKKSTCQCRRLRRHRLDPWVGKMPQRKKWQPAAVFLPGESQDGGAWQATVHREASSHTGLSG